MDQFSFMDFVQLRSKLLPYNNAFLELIPKGICGVYVLFDGSQATYSNVIYIGRSDRDLKKRLATHNHRDLASHFSYYPCKEALHAYVLEKQLYRRILPKLNKIFPAYPSLDLGKSQN